MSKRPSRTPYSTHYYCCKCMLWYPHDECVDYRCSVCGYKVRTVGRLKKGRERNRRVKGVAEVRIT